MKQIIKLFCFLMIPALSLIACTGSNNSSSSSNEDFKTGGPCKYKVSNFKAEVVEIIVTPGGIKDSIKGDKDLHTVYLNYTGGNFTGPRTLNEIYRTQFDAAFISRNKIHKGLVLTGKAKEIVEGTCKPYIVWFDQHFSK